MNKIRYVMDKMTKTSTDEYCTPEIIEKAMGFTIDSRFKE